MSPIVTVRRAGAAAAALALLAIPGLASANTAALERLGLVGGGHARVVQ
jgi:hypothetical protein